MSLAKKRANAKEKGMQISKITTVASPKNISFTKIEHNEELFKKADTPKKLTGEETKKWTHKLYKPLHRI